MDLACRISVFFELQQQRQKRRRRRRSGVGGLDMRDETVILLSVLWFKTRPVSLSSEGHRKAKDLLCVE